MSHVLIFIFLGDKHEIYIFDGHRPSLQ